MRKALELWHSKTDSGALPARSDFDPSELTGPLGKVVLIDVDADGAGLSYRLVGTHITNVTGRDPTGLHWEEAFTAQEGAILREAIDETIRLKTPVRSTGTMKWVGKNYIAVEIIDLPLSTDGASVDMVMRVIDFP